MDHGKAHASDLPSGDGGKPGMKSVVLTPRDSSGRINEVWLFPRKGKKNSRLEDSGEREDRTPRFFLLALEMLHLFLFPHTEYAALVLQFFPRHPHR